MDINRSKWSRVRVRRRIGTVHKVKPEKMPENYGKAKNFDEGAMATFIVFETFIGAIRSAGRKNRLRRITVSPV